MLKEMALENKIQQNQSKIESLEIQLEGLTREEEKLLSELKVSSEQLVSFISKKENFTEENWEELNKQLKQMDEKLHRELENVRNPLKTKRAYSSLNGVQSHWLYVK